MLSRRALLAAGLGAAALEPSFADPAPPADPATRDDVAYSAVEPRHLQGRGFTDTAAPFDRLPARAEATVPPEVWRLSRHSAGLAFECASDARALYVRYRVRSDTLDMAHMPATGVSGLDLYGKRVDAGPAAPWRWAAVFQPRARDCAGPLVEGLDAGEYRWRVYLPLYNGVETLELGVPAGATLTLEPAPPTRPVVCYGTSILHGACASRPGMAWPAIVGRRLGRQVVNLGFSGAGKMEPALAELLAEVDAAAYVVDCAPNMDAALISERAAPFVVRLREARPRTPIVLVEDRLYGYGWHRASARGRNDGNRAALRAVYTQLRERGVEGLAYVPADTLLGAHGSEAMTDGSHPNDLGMSAYADAVTPVLGAVLGPM